MMAYLFIFLQQQMYKVYMYLFYYMYLKYLHLCTQPLHFWGAIIMAKQEIKILLVGVVGAGLAVVWTWLVVLWKRKSSHDSVKIKII